MKRTFIAAAVAVAALSVAACGGAKPPAPQAPPPPQVTVTTLTPQDIEMAFSVPGRLQGSREVEVRSRVKGILQSWAYKEGEPVREGQLLFRIDPASYQHGASGRGAARRPPSATGGVRVRRGRRRA